MIIFTVKTDHRGNAVDYSFVGDAIVSFYDYEDSTKISFKNGEYVWTKTPVAAEIKKTLKMDENKFVRLGE